MFVARFSFSAEIRLFFENNAAIPHIIVMLMLFRRSCSLLTVLLPQKEFKPPFQASTYFVPAAFSHAASSVAAGHDNNEFID
jgi:hypothetical protein